MADARLDMALDDLVSQDRSNRKGRGGGRRGGPVRNTGSSNVRRAAATRNTPYARGNVEGAWQHDMYGGGSGGRGAPAPAARSGGSAKIMVANLNSTVVKDEDMKELFGNVGRVKTARCHYDARGKNLGTAEVEFVRAEDAVAAKREYDGVVLDGKPMKIEIVGGAAAPRVSVMDRVAASGQRTRVPVNGHDDRLSGGRGGPRTSGGQPRDRQAGRGGAGRGARGGNTRGGRGGRGGRGPKPTAEEAVKLAADLDNDLDQYMDTTEE